MHANWLASPQQRIRLGLVLIALFALLRFALLPLLAWQEETRNQIVLLERYQARSHHLTEHRVTTEARLAEYQQALDSLAERYPQENDPRQLQLHAQRQLEELATRHQLKLQRSDWGVASRDTLLSAPLRLRLEGHLDGLYQWLLALDNTSRLYTVSGLDLQPARGRGNEYHYSLDIDLIAYAQPTPPQEQP